MSLNVSLRLKKRVSLLEETVSFIVNLRLELQFRADNLYSLLSSLSALASCRSLGFITESKEKLKTDDSFSSVWRETVKGSALPYRADEKEKLISMADFLGTSDKETQSELLNLYEKYFMTFLKKAEIENEKYSKLCVMLGFVSGMGVFIMVV